MNTHHRLHRLRSPRLPSLHLQSLEPRLLLTQVSFAASTSSQLPFSITDLATADFNRDGRDDLATISIFDPYVQILLNDGSGVSSAPALYPTAAGSAALATGDFNNDGFTDIAVVTNTKTFSILLNKGDGTFFPRVDHAFNESAYIGSQAIAAADFNGDGRIDLALDSDVANTLVIFPNQGNGIFGPESLVAAGQWPGKITAADLNNDGAVDLAVANGLDSALSILFNNGNGTFRPRGSYSLLGSPVSTGLIDINNDGNLDLVASSQGSYLGVLSFFIYDGHGGFSTFTCNTPISGDIAVADFNGDQLDDIALANGTQKIYINRGDTTFDDPLSYDIGPDTRDNITADFNNDGAPDLATASYDSYNVSFLANTTTPFPPAISNIYVSSTRWSPAFFNHLASSGKGDATLGYRLPTGANALKPLPWQGLDQISIQFSKPVNVNPFDGLLTGLNFPYFPTPASSYNGTTWTLYIPNSLPADTFTLSIPANAVTDVQNIPMAADFSRQFNILPADANQDGIVDGGDLDAWFSHLQQSTFDPAQGDLNADGLVDGGDFDLLFTHLQSSLPSSLNLNLNPNLNLDLSSSLTNYLTPQSLATPFITTSATTDDTANSKIKNQKSKIPPTLVQKRLFIDSPSRR